VRARPSAAPRAVREAREQLLLADRPDPAGDALAARLVAEERGDPPERADEIGRLVEDHHDARAEGRAGSASALERHRHAARLPADEDARGAAEQDRPDWLPTGNPAGELDELTQRRPERDLVDAGPRDVPGQAEQLRAGRPVRPDLREAGAATRPV